MKKRMTGVVLAVATGMLLAPASGSADEVDTTCKNGKEPVHYQLTNASPLVKVQLRLLCIQD